LVNRSQGFFLWDSEGWLKKYGIAAFWTVSIPFKVMLCLNLPLSKLFGFPLCLSFSSLAPFWTSSHIFTLFWLVVCCWLCVFLCRLCTVCITWTHVGLIMCMCMSDTCLWNLYCDWDSTDYNTVLKHLILWHL
jgi:hypothetical protein